MRNPIYTIPIFTIEQARAVAGVLRGYLDMQAPCDSEPTTDVCDAIASDEYQDVLAAWCHVDDFINSNKPTCGITCGCSACMAKWNGVAPLDRQHSTEKVS